MDKSDIQETLVSLYLRLNGYFVSGFIVHASRGAATEVDIIAVRFRNHREPQREVPCCPYLRIPPDCTDFIIGEVKGGRHNINFNSRFRTDQSAIRAVLERIGAFASGEIERLSREVPRVLEPEKVRNSKSFPSFAVCDGAAQLRFILFAPDQLRKEDDDRPYVFGSDLLAYARDCFRPKQQRVLCDVHYNYDLWGPQFTEIVRYFKDPSQSFHGGMRELYARYESELQIHRASST